MSDWVEPHYEQRLALHKVLDEMPIDHEKLERAWKSYFCRMLYSSGWNKAAIHQLFAWGFGGHNWKAIWHEDGVSQREKTKSFSSDLSYFSDRMSLDRLFRLHHHYNGIQSKWQLESDSYPTNVFHQ